MDNKNETGVANAFNAAMSGAATERGRSFSSYSFGGSDRDVGADFLHTDSTRFSIVEFKYGEADIRAEGEKPRRVKLCTMLEHSPRMRDLHDSCHFIAWRGIKAIQCNIYRLEVCNGAICAGAGLSAISPEKNRRFAGEDYADRFFGARPPPCTLSRSSFHEYIKWLVTETSGSRLDRVQVMFADENTFGYSSSVTLDVLYELLEARKAGLDRSPGRSDGPNRGPGR